MFDVKKAQKLYDELINYITNYLDKLENQTLPSLKKKKALYDIILKYTTTHDISLLYPLKDSELLNSEIKDAIKKSEFLAKHNSTKAPQYAKGIEIIDKSSYIQNVKDNLDATNNEAIKINQMIQEIKQHLPNSLDIKAVEYFLEISPLSSKQQLEIISYLAYISCEKITKAKIITDSQKEEIKRQNLSDLHDEMIEVINNATLFYTDNYQLIQNENKEFLLLQIELLDALRKARQNLIDINIDELAFKDELLKILLIQVNNTKNDIIELSQTLKNNITEENIEIMRSLIDDLRSDITFGRKLETAVENDNQINIDDEPSKIIILQDEEGKLLIDEKSLTSKEKQCYTYIYKKIENGQYDYAKGYKHSIIKTPSNIKDTIYVNRKDKFAIAFIKCNTDTAILLCASSISSIYTKAQNTYLKHLPQIEQIKKQVISNNTEERVGQK